MVSPGYVLSVVVGLMFLGIGIYSWRNPEVSLFRGANIIDKEVGEGDPSPTERVVAKILSLALILLAVGWLYAMAWPYWLF